MCASMACGQAVPPASSGYFTTDAGRLYYEQRGHGQPLVLLHDGIGHREIWQGQFDALAEHFRVIRYDHRGYGLSDPATAPYYENEDLDALLRYLEVNDPILICASGSSSTCIDFATTTHQTITALILIGPTVRGLTFSDHFIARNQRNSAPALKANPTDDDLREAHDLWIDDPYVITRSNELARQRLRTILEPFALRHQALDWTFWRSLPTPTLERLPDVEVPTLIVTGAHDIPDVHAHAGAIETAMPQAKRVVVPEAGHLVYFEQPTVFNELVRTFVEPLTVADHHVHLLSPQLVADWKAVGMPFSKPDAAYTSIETILDSERLGKALLLSMAHVYGGQGFLRRFATASGEWEAVQRENNYVAEAARRWPHRLIAFCSVHPFRDYALQEVDRCATDLEVSGIKLHLQFAEAGWSSPDQINQLVALFGRINDQSMTLLVHLGSLGNASVEEVAKVFVERLWAPHPHMPIVFAHLGGSGGYTTDDARLLRALLDEKAKHAVLRDAAFYMDISGVLLAEAVQGRAVTPVPVLGHLANDMREVGLQHIVFGSDYPVFSARTYQDQLMRLLPLTPEELAGVFANRIPLWQEVLQESR